MYKKPTARIFFSCLFCLALFCCNEGGALGTQKEGDETIYARLRKDMVNGQIMRRGVHDPRVLEAMLAVRRHRFVPEQMREMAYNDGPLPIGENQTISQPYIVAYMTEALQLSKYDKVLEIGTGSGYQAAVLAKIVNQVYSMEIISSLAQRADETLRELGYNNVKVRAGDGYKGWPEEAPFDAIIVTAAPEEVPLALKKQLKVGGRMIIPVGGRLFHQELILLVRTGDKSWEEQRLLPVRFVPMTGGDKGK